MSQQFNNKDYGEYFSALENSIKRKEQKTNDQPTRKSTSKKIRLNPVACIAAIIIVAIILLILMIPKSRKAEHENGSEIQGANDTISTVDKENKTKDDKFAKFTNNTAEIDADIESQNIVVVNCDTNEVVACRNAQERCYPASTTKIMTILTAVDYISDYTDTFTFSYEVTDPFFVQDSSMAGFANGEKVTMLDMFYGAILPSGADATAGIALSIAGSEEEFVKLMNKKAKELGLKNTNFTNTSGLFDVNHYTTAEDMAVIVREAMKNQICRDVLSTYQHTTDNTPQHQEGITLSSTLFSYMYGTEPDGADILGGKTGFVNESGYCIASFGMSDDGVEYVCVTLKGPSLWPTIYDQIDLYSRYAK